MILGLQLSFSLIGRCAYSPFYLKAFLKELCNNSTAQNSIFRICKVSYSISKLQGSFTVEAISKFIKNEFNVGIKISDKSF